VEGDSRRELELKDSIIQDLEELLSKRVEATRELEDQVQSLTRTAVQKKNQAKALAQELQASRSKSQHSADSEEDPERRRLEKELQNCKKKHKDELNAMRFKMGELELLAKQSRARDKELENQKRINQELRQQLAS
jgi:hypothetical protein